jgi:hypothetical protein
MGAANVATTADRRWLVRIPEVYAALAPQVLGALYTGRATPLSGSCYIIQISGAEVLRTDPAGIFVSWNLPLDHTWPCCPQDMEGFVEKAAQALLRKFGGSNVQTVLAGALDPASPNRYYRTLASNLRGRVLQLFPGLSCRDAEEQDASRPTLFCLVGKEGLFCGVSTPAAANGVHPGGMKFIRHGGDGSISRAGAKIAGALHYLKLLPHSLPAGSRWLEIGASPGGMTAELLDRGFAVTAVDRAPLDARLRGRPGLEFVQTDAAAFAPLRGREFRALLSDLNGPAHDSMAAVLRLSRHLEPGSPVVFTLKTPGAETFEAIVELFNSVRSMAGIGGLTLQAATHLPYNRHEFTLFFQKSGHSGKR